MTGNRSYNGVQCGDLAVIPYEDVFWHHVSFAYNSVTNVTTFWKDGKFHGTLTFPTAGLWIISSDAITSGKAIEFDDLKVWTLTEETSGKTHLDEGGNTVYDSYDFIVGQKLDLTMPALSQPENTNIIITEKEVAIKGNVTVGTVCALGDDVAVINSDGTAVTDSGARITDSMYVVVTDEDGKLYTYSVSVYNEGYGIWYTDLAETAGNYTVKVLNTSPSSLSVKGYAKNTVTGNVYASQEATVVSGGIITVNLGAVSANKTEFFLWNNNLMPLCLPFEN